MKKIKSYAPTWKNKLQQLRSRYSLSFTTLSLLGSGYSLLDNLKIWMSCYIARRKGLSAFWSTEPWLLHVPASKLNWNALSLNLISGPASYIERFSVSSLLLCPASSAADPTCPERNYSTLAKPWKYSSDTCQF